MKREIETADASPRVHHHRCYRVKATDRFIVLGRTGTELIDLSGGKNDRNCWVRGTCQYGVMPANGLLYAPPHACGCYMQAKLAGMWALGPEPAPWPEVDASDRLESLGEAPTAGPSGETDWPTYRHDRARSGTTRAETGGKLSPAWDAKVGRKLSAPVVVGDMVYVADIATHTVHAVSLQNGDTIWRYTAAGAVDSPPTFYEGMVIFGSGDGRVHCLDASDGEPVWRFLAAPCDRRVVSRGRLESVWPVHGSVLVQNDSVWVVAGRSSYLDGGFACYRLDPHTGEVQAQGRLNTEGVETGAGGELYGRSGRMKGALDDILSGNGETAFMRQMQLGPDFQQLPPEFHLFSMVGFLDDSWFSRSYWFYGSMMWGYYRGWAMSADYSPFGRILSIAPEDVAYGFRRPGHGTGIEGRNQYFFYKATFHPDVARERLPDPNKYNWKGAERQGCVTEHWRTKLPIWVRAMAVAGDAVVVAGPHAPGSRDTAAALAGKKGSRLMLLSREDGEALQEIELSSPPAWDALAVVPGRVVVSGTDGRLRCFAGE